MEYTLHRTSVSRRQVISTHCPKAFLVFNSVCLKCCVILGLSPSVSWVEESQLNCIGLKDCVGICRMKSILYCLAPNNCSFSCAVFPFMLLFLARRIWVSACVNILKLASPPQHRTRSPVIPVNIRWKEELEALGSDVHIPIWSQENTDAHDLCLVTVFESYVSTHSLTS